MGLRPYQVADAAWLGERSKAFILHDPRVGKTPIAFTAAARLGLPVAFITRAIVREQMQAEAARWAPGLPVFIESYERLTASADARRALHAFRPGIFVLDEAQRLKTPTAQRTRTFYGTRCDGDGLIAGAPHVWVLSGTLAPNHLGEVWTHLRAFGKVEESYTDFLYRHCYVAETKYGPKPVGVRKDRLTLFRAYFQGIVRRRRFAEVFPEIPKLRWETEPLPVPPEMRKKAGRLLAPVAWVEGQELDDATLEEVGHLIEPNRRQIGLIKAPLVAEAVTALLDDGVAKVVVFAWHHDVLDLLHHKLALRFDLEQVDGRTATAARAAALTAFREHPSVRVLLAQVQTAQEGIDLSVARTCVFAESSWSPGDMLQGANRIVSAFVDSRPEVIVYSLGGTLDTAIARTLQRKAEHLMQFNQLEAADGEGAAEARGQ